MIDFSAIHLSENIHGKTHNINMRAIESKQPNAIDSNDSQSVTGGNDYIYRPLTKHRRAGSTGTTGDEEYTTDEDELYFNKADYGGKALNSSYPILKSDLARAATDLFEYLSDETVDNVEPTSLFDEDDKSFCSLREKVQQYDQPIIDKNPTTSCRMNKMKTNDRSKDIQVSQQAELLNLNQKIKNFYKKISAKDHESTRNSVAINQEFISLLDYTETELKTDVVARTNDVSSLTNIEWEEAAKEFKDDTLTQLHKELKKAHEELKLKEEEIVRLSYFRQDVETELEELTANLFQEAHKMVRQANARQATAERLLKENRMKTEVLAAEVAALKTLVLTSTPAHPNPHLHPQIDTRCKFNSSDDFQMRLLNKKYRTSPSQYNRENSPPESPTKEQKLQFFVDIQIHEKNDQDHVKELQEKDKERSPNKYEKNKYFGIELDPTVYSEFLTWKSNPCIDKSNAFVSRVFQEDIDLCLTFPNEDLGMKVRQAVLDGIILIEAINDKNKSGFSKTCALLEVPRQCYYRMQLSDQENQWYSISQICRNRIIAVCDFLNYLRYVERGLVKSAVHDIYWEIMRLRKGMVLARLGFILSS
ncbi:guanine nucleotide exchange factor for Rab-3A-like isoform X2 [Chelonus insularis]|uniref:guanine nucleotide exchange factor for Rab-3A-like isoform X2 n=1 Tax=Chelonus insularis TaxID=460826 RepID=UPI001588DEB8|nr:guanine nucleotide exchange factor for Rab-3A-like isoform X2 [Chelonus insularis]XP_034939584.1 guanine nucleotide exchange factor for Rab-3A-like isoform X2 [Chelonus insularis]XP_034939585.1 guanine nucleotide exchange factor for Rab-3A-like isoform X2 [Chelonus insularis]XP_034939586.1 guanine nucleotide exchange factor for Rab-3A-like isoform X2 [Chelonus insularis]XP_034939587.1 guanine nucleotide exchange factor for Rab-3A-like isoform X2 [Chelonus insularis]XP_034939588.1 guanine nu